MSLEDIRKALQEIAEACESRAHAASPLCISESHLADMQAIAEKAREALAILASEQVAEEEIARIIDPIAFNLTPAIYGMQTEEQLERLTFVVGPRAVATMKARAILSRLSLQKKDRTP